MQQRSEEWFQARLGKVTASRLKDVVKKTKSGSYTAGRASYMNELLCQRLSGTCEEGISNAAMRRGEEMEPVARGAYEADKGVFVDDCGLIQHPSESSFAASPDGLVGNDGLLEIKCPTTPIHIEFLRSGEPKEEYIWQMHGQMLCTNRKWCDFVSYDDRVLGLEYKCIRVEYDEEIGSLIIGEVSKFLNELDRQHKYFEDLKRSISEVA